MRTVSTFSVGAGAEVSFALTWHPSYRPPTRRWDPAERLAETEAWWREWSESCALAGEERHPWREAVTRLLVTLKALTFQPAGGILAAPTTSLPEAIGGERNWDYRFCWIREATLTLLTFLSSGYRDEARAWREWMLRAAAGHPGQLLIMYGLVGERRLAELELPWLSGCEGSQPVRAGNAAHEQLQIDVYGELMDALHVGRKFMLEPSEASWSFQLPPTVPTKRAGDAAVPRMRSLQKFAAVHASVSNHFNHERSLSSRAIFKLNRTAALAVWRGLVHGLAPCGDPAMTSGRCQIDRIR